MTTVTNWEDMRQFGIIFLTGEADGMGLRILCDLTGPGVELVRGFLNLPDGSEFRPNMNKEGVANMALPRSCLLDLASVALSKEGKKWIVMGPNMVFGIDDTTPFGDVESFLNRNKDFRLVKRPA